MRPRKYMAGPKRVIYKNLIELKTEYRIEYAQWFLLGAMLTWPIACLIGKRAQRYQGGVGVAPYQRLVEEWPNGHPTRISNKFFNRYAFGSCFIVGNLLAGSMADSSKLSNEWYTRPDLKPKAAMVNDSHLYEDTVLKQMYETNYNSKGDDHKKSNLYRMLRPLDANYDTYENNYAGRHEISNNRGGKFPTLNTDYVDHEN
jgi:hypothetical protein